MPKSLEAGSRFVEGFSLGFAYPKDKTTAVPSKAGLSDLVDLCLRLMK